MAYSYYDMTGTGGTLLITLPFPYIERSHVSVLVNGTSVPFTWLSDTVVQPVTNPALGTKVRVKRTTPSQVAEFSSPSDFRSSILNNSLRGLLYNVQEAVDGQDASLTAANSALALAQQALDELANFVPPGGSGALIGAGGVSFNTAGTTISGTTVQAALVELDGDIQSLGGIAKGPTAPTSPEVGQLWIEDDNPSATVWTLRIYDGTAWVAIGTIDTTTGTFTVTAYTHTHTSAAITDFAEAVDDRVAALIVAGTGIVETYDDAAGTLTLAVDTGTTANKIPRLDASGRLPAVDGSQLTGISAGGKLVDRAYAERTVTTLLGLIPWDGTVPQNNEGAQLLSASITPKSVTNRLRIQAVIPIEGLNGNAHTAAALFVNTEANARSVTWTTILDGYSGVMVIQYEYVPGVTTAQTISVRAGTNSGSNANAVPGGNFGGTKHATLVIEEIAP